MRFRTRNIHSYAFGETVGDFGRLLFGANRLSAYCASFGTFRQFRLFVETLGDAAYFGARFETLGAPRGGNEQEGVHVVGSVDRLQFLCHSLAVLS